MQDILRNPWKLIYVNTYNSEAFLLMGVLIQIKMISTLQYGRYIPEFPQ